MSETYHVRIEKDYLVFSAAHFITYGDNTCERLHGHNYRVVAEVHGPLDEHHLVVDFVLLRERLGAILSELDHRMLVPMEHPRIEVESDDREVTVRFEDRRWTFPREDCLLLPIPNTTAEMLARYIGLRLRDAIRAVVGCCPETIRIDVDENHGQWGVCELRSE